MCSKVVATLQQPLRIITNFQVCDLLDFYQGLIENVVGTANEDGKKEVQLPAMRGEGREEDDDLQELAATISIDALRELAGTKFLGAAEKYAEDLRRQAVSFPAELRPSVSIVEAAAELGKIIDARRNSMMGSSSSAIEGRFETVLLDTILGYSGSGRAERWRPGKV